MRRCHPKTLNLMQPHLNADGSIWIPRGGAYANLASQDRDEDGTPTAPSMPDAFYPYVHEVFPPAVSLAGRPVAELSVETHQRDRDKAKLKPRETVHVSLRMKHPAACLVRDTSGYDGCKHASLRNGAGG